MNELEELSEAEETLALVLYLSERGRHEIAIKRLQQWNDEHRKCQAPECVYERIYCAEHINLAADEQITALTKEIDIAKLELRRIVDDFKTDNLSLLDLIKLVEEDLNAEYERAGPV